MTLNDLTTGKTVHGPNLTLADMKGKVVFVEYWGTNCPPCRALLPRLAELYKKYETEGFHIIGLECQGSAAAAIVELVKTNGVTYQITTGGNLKDSNVSGIPHGFLFGADGKLAVDNPHGAELEKNVKELLKMTAAAMAGPGPYKKLAAAAAQIRTGQGLGAVLKMLRAKKDSKDVEEAKEAQMMFEALNDSAQGRLDRALEIKANAPLASLRILDLLALQFTGDEIGVKAKIESDNLKKDPAVKKEIEADIMWTQLDKMNNELKPFRGQKNPKAAEFRKANAVAIQSIVGGCQTLIQRYPDTSAAKKAQDLIDQYR
ncbi:MAG: TlpA disulfide reductase family protein [Planctomycetota bacterium]